MASSPNTPMATATLLLRGKTSPRGCDETGESAFDVVAVSGWGAPAGAASPQDAPPPAAVSAKVARKVSAIAYSTLSSASAVSAAREAVFTILDALSADTRAGAGTSS